MGHGLPSRLGSSPESGSRALTRPAGLDGPLTIRMKGVGVPASRHYEKYSWWSSHGSGMTLRR